MTSFPISDTEVATFLTDLFARVERDAELSRALDCLSFGTPEYEIAHRLIRDGWHGTWEELLVAAKELANG